MKTKLGTQVGLDPGHTVLDRDPGLPPPKGHSPTIFSRHLLWHMAGWIKMPLCVRWEPSSPSPKRGRGPIFSTHVYCGQTAGWTKMARILKRGTNSANLLKIARDTPPWGVCIPNFDTISVKKIQFWGAKFHPHWCNVSPLRGERP